MSTPALALFARSLRLESRQLRFYLVRLGLLVVTLFALMTAHAQSTFLSASGLYFFQTIIYINFFFISLAAVSYFASAIAEEKEEMTLGLLRMTGLSPVSILLGKSTSRMLGVVMLLTVQFPFTLLAITLGGVGMVQIGAAYCTLGAYIILLSNIALLCSVMCRRAKSAGGLTGLAILGFFLIPVIGPPIFRGLGWTSAGAPNWTDTVFAWMYEASAFTRLMEILRSDFAGSALGYQVVSNLILGGLFFLLAWLVFDFFTREQKQAAPSRGLVFRRTSLLRWLGSRRAWRHPLVWKDFNFIAGGIGGMIIRLFAYAAIIAVVLYLISLGRWSGRPDRKTIGATIMWLMLTVMFLELCYHASRVFREEIKWKTLPAIMLLPISTYRIVCHKILGCLIAVIPAAAFFALGALIAPSLFWDGFVAIASSPFGWLSLLFVIFFLHLVAFFSTVVKRGALAISFGVTYLMSNLISPILFIGPFQAAIVLCAIMLSLTVFLHFLIGKRLEKAAAE